MHVKYWLQAATFTRVICTTTAQLLPNVLQHHRNTQPDWDALVWPRVASDETPASWATSPISLDQALQNGQQGADPSTVVLHPTPLRSRWSLYDQPAWGPAQAAARCPAGAPSRASPSLGATHARAGKDAQGTGLAAASVVAPWGARQC